MKHEKAGKPWIRQSFFPPMFQNHNFAKNFYRQSFVLYGSLKFLQQEIFIESFTIIVNIVVTIILLLWIIFFA